jgi:hypothetical protein|tara:strand:- start:337 stop:534 length:198 start_codon:yes stop_codon:yes gene_type:complete
MNCCGGKKYSRLIEFMRDEFYTVKKAPESVKYPGIFNVIKSENDPDQSSPGLVGSELRPQCKTVY